MATEKMTENVSILAISGGVGGAKLCLGLSDELVGSNLHIVVNTGDDFRHLGLHISPDIDTLLYTLSERNNVEQGWGLRDESWNVMSELENLGGDTWFRLGDKDLATHFGRTTALAKGAGLCSVVDLLATRMGIANKIYSMSENSVQTIVSTDEGELAFQDYFVRLQCQPVVTGFRFEGIDAAQPDPAILQLLKQQSPFATIICPSNPFVSIDPILQLPGMWQALRDSSAPVIAVSPIVDGVAVKGPAAKMMKELDMPVNSLAVAEYYCDRYPDLLSGFVIDNSDVALADAIRSLGVDVYITNTIMHNRQDKQRLAQFILQAVVCQE
ncbi:MAG: 2-phospho-L-lactate transferase [Spongiibacteraceae bacterium]